MKLFAVAGAVMEDHGSFLFVCNRRRDATLDWSPPGGVIDAGETPLAALRREVSEETNLQIGSFGSHLYSVRVDFEPLGWRLQADVWRAESWSGDLHVDDPDGVVIEAGFFSGSVLDGVLTKAPRWVAEPFRSVCLPNTDEPTREGNTWSYRAVRNEPADGGGFEVTALA